MSNGNIYIYGAPASGKSTLGKALAEKIGADFTDLDAVIVEKLARIFTGGDALAGEQITEEDVLYLERKAFMDLCRNEKTLERIKGMVATGKPVRN